MTETSRRAPLGSSRPVVYKLAALFSLDAFTGGFAIQSLTALWLFERFHLSVLDGEPVVFLGGLRERISS